MDKIIQQGFPELLSEDISVEFSELEDAVMESGQFKEEGYYIEIDKSIQEASNDVLMGGLAHELAHIVTEKEFTSTASFSDRMFYRLSKRYRQLDERNTDLEVLLRGFGKQLLKFLEYCEMKGFPHYKEDGFTIRELKILLKSNKKT